MLKSNPSTGSYPPTSPLATQYRQSTCYREMLAETGAIFNNFSTSLSTEVIQELRYPTSWFVQVCMNSKGVSPVAYYNKLHYHAPLLTFGTK